MADYSVISTVPNTYIGRGGKAVSGYAVTVLFPEFDEEHQLNVPNLDASTVKTEAEKLLAKRRELAEL